MPPQYDLYVRRNTWLHRLDPRVKSLFVLEASLVLFIWPKVWSAAAMVVLCGVLLWQGQVPRHRIVPVLRGLAPLLLLVLLLTALFTQAADGGTLFKAGPLVVTAGAVRLGAMLALRLLALALIIFLWLCTTDQATMVRGFLALHVPYTWGLTLALALRYLPIFAGLFDQVREAQQARGLDLQAGSFWQRLGLYRPVLISMIIIAVRQSEQLGWALEARALGALGVRRTIYQPLIMKRLDWLALGALLVALLAVLLMLARFRGL